MSCLDAICEPIGRAMNSPVWDEDEQGMVLNPACVAEQERVGVAILMVRRRLLGRAELGRDSWPSRVDMHMGVQWPDGHCTVSLSGNRFISS